MPRPALPSRPQPLVRARVYRAFTLVALAAAGGLAGCAEVVRSGGDEVSVETQFWGEIMPGTRHWLGWLSARDYCAAQGKTPEIKDLQGSIATYRCVPD